MTAPLIPANRLFLITLGVTIVAGMFCTPPPFEFKLTNNYKREHFLGRELSGSTVGICMLLSDTGIPPPKTISSAAIVKKIRENRSDLVYSGPDSVFERLKNQSGEAAVAQFRSELFNGDMGILLTSDSLWHAVGNDYLLVIRLRRGMYIRTFNQMIRKRFIVEAELWDCREIETVWRVVVDGSCSRPGYSDRKILLEALGSIAAALPASLPAYDTKSW